MEKILPFKDPYVKCYNHHGFSTGIVSQTNKQKRWIYNHYIQLTSIENKIDFKTYFFMEDGVFIKGFHQVPNIKNDNSLLIDIIKELLNEKSYISGNWNDYYICYRSAYQKYNSYHNYIIYGFNDLSKTFYSAGYLKDTKWHDFFEVSYKDYIKAVSDNEDYVSFDSYIYNTLFEQEIDVYRIKEEIQLYLYSSNLYDGINGCLNYLRDMNNISTIIPSLWALHEHKVLMLERLKFLTYINLIKLSNDAISRYSRIADRFGYISNLGLKYSFTKNKNIFKQIYELAESNFKEEERILVDII